MIKLSSVNLNQGTLAQLKKYQEEVDEANSFSERVVAAKKLFKKRNTLKNKTFKVIRQTLDLICPGLRRCCYCEDSVADEVEHIKPKDWYPELVFVWENYLYACGPCNGPKNNRYGIFHQKNGQIIHLSRTRAEAILEPPPGDPLLIDPRAEDPLDFLELDLSGTFYFLPRDGLDKRHIQRAEYTIELLKLNERDVLTRARRNAYRTYLARLEQYINQKAKGAKSQVLSPLIKDLKQVPHPTVWQEIKRQAIYYPHLRKCFQRVPEAKDW